MNIKIIASVGVVLLCSLNGYAQVLHLDNALQRSAENYDRIKSKKSIVSAFEQNTAFQKQQYLPDFTLSAQQSFGTINALHGPMYAYGGLGSAATSVPLAEQNWNAAFGSLYFANVNWNLFTFGRIKNEVKLGQSKEKTAIADLEQEIFQLQVKTSAAYLNLLASQRIQYVQEKNLERAQVFFEMTDSRAKSGLIPEVDASLAKAEVSHAKSLQIKSYDKVLEYSKQLAVFLGEEFQTYQLDSLYSTTIPKNILSPENSDVSKHPLLQLQQSKVDQSLQSESLVKTQRLPNLSAFGVLQGRGSGFESNYMQDNSAFSGSYLKGVGIDRGNYLLGFTFSGNITNLSRFNSKVKEQQYFTQSLKQDYDRLHKELNAQSKLAQSQLANAYENFEETKVQLSAAQLAYRQHTALYENGLTTLVDYTQALYALNRAEIDYEIAQNNVWQALLLLASSQGDLEILTQKH
ncbi:MAG: TolC family protein [Tolumonas sp.]|nr:MAG: TolC family protein [Tolumonas sp.]